MSIPKIDTGRFGLPLRGVSMSSDIGVVRTPFAAGNVRQRRLHGNLPTTVELAWQVRANLLPDLTNFLSFFGVTGWIQVPFESRLSAQSSEPSAVSWHTVRIISPIATQNVGWALYHVSATFEIDTWGATAPFNPTAVGSIVSGKDAIEWVIARTPGDPSSPDVYIAKKGP